MAALAVALLQSPAAGSAENSTLSVANEVAALDLPVQPLARSLTSVAKSFGVRLVSGAELTQNRSSPAMQGNFTFNDALTKLLAGTNLTYRFTDERTITLFDRAAVNANAQGIQLETITVEGAKTNPNAVIGPPPPPFAGGQVATGSRLGILGNSNFMDAPFSTTSFTNQFKTEIDALSLSDVLRFSSSVTAAATGPNNITDAMYIRGFWGASTSYDGLSGLEFRQPQLDNIERVELLLGPSAFLYGQPASVGGSINLVPKRAGDAPLTSIGTRYISRENIGVFTDVSRRYGENKEFGIRVNGSYSNGETEYKDVVDRRMDFESIALDYRLERFRWTFDFANHSRKAPAESWFDLDVGVQVPRVDDAARQFMPKWAYYEASYQLAMSRVEVDLNDKWTVSAAYGHTWMNDHRFSQVYTIIDNIGTLSPIYYGAGDYRGKFTNSAGEAMVRGEFDTGPLVHKIRAGVSYLGDTARYAGNYVPGTPNTNIYNPTFPAMPAIPSAVLPGHDLDESTTVSLFVGDQISMFNDRLQFIVGVRRVSYDSTTYNGAGVANGGYEEVAITPAYAIVFKPLNWLSIYANHVEALEPGYRVDPAGGAANAGQVLPPAHSKQKEVGVKFDFGRLAFTSALFEIERPSVFRDPVSNVESYNGLQRNRGVEFNVFGEPVKGLRVLAGATFLDAELVDTFGGANDGNRPSDVPKMTLVGHVDWDVPWVSGLSARLGVLHTGSVFADFDQANQQLVPSWTRVDAGLRYKVKYGPHEVVYRLNVDNVLDERYFQVERQTLYSGAGRTFITSVTAFFN